MSFVEVHAGTFTCPHCGARWVGSWRGPRHLITCLACRKPIHAGGRNTMKPQRLPRNVANRARGAGGRFVAFTGDTIVGTADTVADLMMIQAIADVDYGQIVEVAGSAVGVVADIAGGVVEMIQDVA